MNTDDKQQWLERHGSITFFHRGEPNGGTETIKPYLEWTSWTRTHSVSARDNDAEGVSLLYDRVKTSLYSIIEHIEQC